MRWTHCSPGAGGGAPVCFWPNLTQMIALHFLQ